MMDAGTPDTTPASCQPVLQSGCPGAQDACHVVPGGALSCQLEGPGAAGTPCQFASDCSKGTGCISGPGGWLCREYCDLAAGPGNCPGQTPMCIPVPGSSMYGTCQPGAGTDAGTASCDPIQRTGCGRVEDACYALEGTSALVCQLSGTTPEFSPCDVHSNCAPGAGCFDGQNGRLCRPYCDLLQPDCPGQAPVCMMIGRSDYGACAATAPVDAGLGDVMMMAQDSLAI